MKAKKYSKHLLAVVALLFMALQVSAQTLTGPTTVGDGITPGQVYTTDPGMSAYSWSVSSAGAIITGLGTETITVDWTNPLGNQTVTVSYTDINGAALTTTLVVLYYPFPPAIDPTTIPQFVDPMPHFAAGLRVNAKAGGNLVVKNTMVQQVALSTGTPMPGGRTIGDGLLPKVGLGNYAAYSVSYNGGAFGPAMWPAQTIEAQQGNQLIVEYRNELYGATYKDFNILADQTLMMNGYPLNGNPNIEPYNGPIPMSVHLHGGEMPSNSDGGPTAWFMPGPTGLKGPGFNFEASNVCTYPNLQEGTTLWYHPHDQGLTRINVYTGLAGYYFLRGTNEDALHLPGWSGDAMVQEVTPPGKTPTFNGTNQYLPEVELAIQDRMFNVNGALYWPVAPTNPEVNPYWTPEFVGDVMTVNGKSWPYLSVAPRKYAFRMLDGCNARFLNMWLSSDPTTGVMDGPSFTILSTEGGFLQAPVTSQVLFLAPAERPIVIIDFTGYEGKTFTLMNDANAPYPTGDPIIPGLTDRIMQFVVNGIAVAPDNSTIPANLRPSNPMVKLTNFDGTNNVTPVKTRQLILNEIIGAGGPVRVAINNSHFDDVTPAAEGPAYLFGGPTETPLEGTTEIWQIMNTTADAHPIHPHLVQFQLVSRQAINSDLYMADYATAWAGHIPLLPNYPDIATYPGGAGPPFPYDVPNADGALGGNPAFSTYLGPVINPLPEEMGWKDAIKSLPGHVETYMVRMAPTEVPLNATPEQMVFPFDPSIGPGYVYHCHIIDHEDMDMMRPMLVSPAQVRLPNITAQPINTTVCTGWPATLNVTATSINAITYQWEVSTNGTTWTPLTNVAPYSNVTTATMTINPADIAYNLYQYHCVLTTANGSATTIPVTLTVNQSPTPILTGLSPACPNVATLYSTDAGMTNYVWTVSAGGTIAAGTGTTAAASVTWTPPGMIAGPQTLTVNYTNANGCSAFTPSSYVVNVNPLPAITGPATVCQGAKGNVYITQPGMTGYIWKVGVGGTITAGGTTIDNTVTVKWLLAGPRTVRVNFTNATGCNSVTPTVYNVTVNPLPVATITGPTIVSLQTNPVVNYVTQAGMTGYVWKVTGGTIQSGLGTNSVNVLWTSNKAGSKISVSFVGAFGCTSNVATLNIMVKKSEEVAFNAIPTSDNAGISELKFEVFPVPNDGKFKAVISSPNEDSYSIQVFSAIGVKMHEVKDIKVSGVTSTDIDIRPAPAGMYTVLFKNNQNKVIKKILINK